MPASEGQLCDVDTEACNVEIKDVAVLTSMELGKVAEETAASESQDQMDSLPLATTEHLGTHRSYWRDMM